MRLTFKTVGATNEVFKRLCCLRRWTHFVTEDKYNELAKQSLNCITAFFLATCAEHEGKTIIWERFPKIAIYRAFQKTYVYFDTPEFILKDICRVGKIEVDTFDQTTRQIIAEQTDDAFADFICEGIGTYEAQIYKAATKLATFIELLENERKMNGDFIHKYHEIIETLKEYEDIPMVKELSTNPEHHMFKVIQHLSQLRNQNRWAVNVYNMECSVLGHLFDTAVFAYYMSLEQDMENEKLATRMFFMGIFHDVAESWTKDIPSPIKDRVKGFRKATEEYENMMIEEHMYDVLPRYVSDALKKVMFEEDGNQEFHALIKGADYLSADSECWRQYKAGSRDEYFRNATLRRKNRIEAGKEVLTPACRELFEYFVEYEKGLNL